MLPKSPKYRLFVGFLPVNKRSRSFLRKHFKILNPTILFSISNSSLLYKTVLEKLVQSYEIRKLSRKRLWQKVEQERGKRLHLGDIYHQRGRLVYQLQYWSCCFGV